MNEELKKIVQNMIDAGESEENIALVIQSYKSKKPEVVAEETASVAAETPAAETPAVKDTELVSKDISLDGQPEQSILIAGNRVYLKDIIGSLQAEDTRSFDEQNEEYKQTVTEIAKDNTLSQQQKNEKISTIVKPSYLVLKSGVGKDAVYEPREDIKSKVAKNMPSDVKQYKTLEDLSDAIDSSISKTIQDDENVKFLFDLELAKKKDLIDDKKIQIQQTADLTTKEGVDKANNELKEFIDQEVNQQVLKSPEFKKIIKDLQVVAADVTSDLNKEFGRYNDDFLRFIDESSVLSLGGFTEGVGKSIQQAKSSGLKTQLSLDQLGLQEMSESAANLQAKIDDGTLTLDDEVEVIEKEIGPGGKPIAKIKKFKVSERLEDLKNIKQKYASDINEGLSKIKKVDDYIALFDSPEVEGFGFEYLLNAAKAAPATIGEQAVNIGIGAASVLGGPITAGLGTAAMFSQEYAGNYWDTLRTGLTEELGREPTNEEYYQALEEGKYASQANAVAFAGLQTAAERFGMKSVLGNTFKKLGINAQDGVGSLYKGEIKKFLKKVVAGGANMSEAGFKEFITETTQGTLGQLSTGTQLGGATDIFKYIKPEEAFEEGEAGFITGFFMPFGGNVARQTVTEIRNASRDVATKFDLTSNIGLAQADKFFKAAQQNIDNKFKEGEITAEEKQVEQEALANTRNAGLKIPKNFSTSAKQKSFDLILERQNLQDQVNREDEAFTVPAKERIKEINTELGNIQSVETATRAAVKAVEKADIDLNVIELDTEADVESYLKENTNMAASKAKEAGKQRGFIMPDGKTIIINKDVASKEGAVTTAAHEILHGVLFNTLNKGDESAFALANAIKMQLSNISTEDFKNSDLAARIEQYKADPDINEATKAEEVLTLFSEALAIGDIKFNENVFTKIKDFVRRILQNAGFSKIDFNDSKDVYNFIKDYNKSVAKGKFTKAQVKAAKEGVAVGRRLKERVEDVAEKGVDETILKFSKQASDNVQKIYEEQGVGGALDIIEEFKPIVNKIVQRRSEAPNFDRQLLTDEIETGRRGLLELIQDYNIESGVPLAAYINKFLPARAIEASKRVLGETFEEDISQRVDIAAPEVEVEVKVKEEKVPRSLRKKLNIEKGSDLYNKVKDAVVKTFGTKLPEVTDPKFKKALSDSYKRELKKEVNALMGTRSDFKMFVTNNAETLYKSIPQETINKRFQAFSEPVLDKDGKPVREKTAVGKGVFKKKPFNKEEFINYFLGEDVGASTKGTRKTALSETIADEMALDATMEVIEDPKVFEKFKEIQEIEGKKVPKDIKPKISEKVKRPEGFKFSLSTKPIQDQLNELALLRDKKAIAKYLGFNSEAINESNREELQAIMQEAVEKGYIDKAVIEAGAMASGGRQTFYGNENTRFDNYYKAKKAGIKNIGKYFKTKDGNFYRFADAVVVNNSVLAKNTDKYKKQIANVDPALWIAKPGRLYWSKEDPAYIKLFEKAKDSQFDKNGYKQINISKKGKFIGQENLINKLDKKVKGTNKTQSEINMDMLDHVVTQLSKAVDNGMSMDIAGMIIIQSYQATGGLIKTAAPFKYISDVFEAGDKIETRSKKLYREEHNPPASVVGANLLWAIKNNAAKPMMKEVRKNFSQTILSKKDDSKLDVNYAATMPIGTNMSTNPIIRMAMAGINLNTVSDIRTRQTYADKFGLGVDNKFKNIENVADYQNKLIEEVTLKGLDIKEAKKQLDQYLKIAPSQLKASKSTNKTLNDSKVLDVEGNLNIQDLLSKAASIDEALNIARDVNAPIKKIRVFDFDDTLATTKSDVLFTAPDGTEGKLNAEEFAKRGKQLLDEGYVFDFSEFNKVTKGKPGPLLEVAKKIQAARGTEDVFVLTARAPEAQVAIKEFLDGVGLNIPLENITGLGNSTGEAKANWMIDKAAEGYNDFYFADDAYQNVRAVKDAMSVLDVKSKVQQAKFSLAKDLNSDFNKILENKTGIGAEKVYSDARAKTVGSNKGKFKFFIPPSAEDFVGLLYPTLAKGKLGDQQMAWYKERLLNPFARAMENLSRDRVNLMNDFKALKKELEVPKDLRKEAIDGFTNEQAVRVYLWNKQGLDIPGISKRDLKDLTEVIDKNPKLKVFADQLQAINKSEGYPAPQDSWLVGTITTDLINGLNTVKRAKYLEEWQTNADIIFSKENLNKMEAVYGPKYREAMENILSRMKTGKNRLFSESRIGNQVLDYINGSIGAIMFFNTRSAVLQTISSINFINWSDNNIYKAGKAFANQPQYWKDFTTLMNSDFLKDRRQGLKLNISESEIADAAKTSKNKAKAALNYILQKGFLPTQIADSFAIASGGATFYRNKINSLVKEGVSEKEAEAIAYREFREIAEESQQSSRPDKISQQQASNVGRVILAFANTPSQYARIIKKAVSDLKNKRGNWKNNVSKIIYYGAMQNLIFNILQQALFAVGFGDDEEESKEREKKYISIGNGMIDSLLRGLGYGGAAVSVAKNLLLDVYERSKRDRPEYVDAAWKLLDFSPPIDSKVSKLKAAGYMVDKYGDDMISKGFAIDNPAYEAASKVVSATTNVPLDRVFTKANNISAAMGEDAETWQRVALMLGWPEWQLKPKEKKKREEKKQAVKSSVLKGFKTIK
jgi:hypothetical protein